MLTGIAVSGIASLRIDSRLSNNSSSPVGGVLQGPLDVLRSRYSWSIIGRTWRPTDKFAGTLCSSRRGRFSTRDRIFSLMWQVRTLRPLTVLSTSEWMLGRLAAGIIGAFLDFHR
jgi:hypothetical protein